MHVNMTFLLVILYNLSTCMSMVPVMYQVTTSNWATYLSNLYDYKPRKEESHFATSPYYPRLAGVYNMLGEEEMGAPVYQKVDLFTGIVEQAYLFRREGGKLINR